MDTESRIRLSVDISLKDHRTLLAVAKASGRSVSDLVRRSVPLIKLCHEAQAEGHYLGVAADRTKLDRELPDIL